MFLVIIIIKRYFLQSALGVRLWLAGFLGAVAALPAECVLCQYDDHFILRFLLRSNLANIIMISSSFIYLLNGFFVRYSEIRQIKTFPQYELGEILTFLATFSVTNYALNDTNVNIHMVGYLISLFMLCMNVNMAGLGVILAGVVFIQEKRI